MPASRAHRKQRDYKHEYQAYHSTPEQIHNRSLRNQARRKYEKKHGNLPASVDVDHIKPIVKGGSNLPSNTRARNRTSNRAFKRTKSAGMK